MSNEDRDTFGELRNRYFDGSEPFMHGHQIMRVRESKKVVPAWANDRRKIQRTILRAFPKMNTDPKERARAGRWARVVYLYYIANLSRRGVAVETGLSAAMVHDILTRVRRAATGQRCDNRGLRGVRPRGRPKNVTKQKT